MKDILVLLVLLSAGTTKVYSEPYPPDSNGSCRDPAEDYLVDGSNLCCKRCPPGQRLTRECSGTADTVCEPCPRGLYMAGRNYSPNCRTCKKCRKDKGLQYAQSCSSTENAKCECQPGMFCMMGYEESDCEECRRYKLCKVGWGVSVQGTVNSDVKCQRCPDGTFSDTVSDKDPCLPHTDCHGRAVVKNGTATSDTECAPGPLASYRKPQTSTKETQAEVVYTSATPTSVYRVATTSNFKASTDSTLSVTLSVSPELNPSTKHPPPSTVSMVSVIMAVVGFIPLIIIVLLCLCRARRKKDAAGFYPKVDANGNCEAGDQIKEGYVGETLMTSFTVTSQEQQCLLEKGEACSVQSQSQSSNNTESLTRTDGCSSEESIGPLQSTVCHSPSSALPEPLPLLSYSESDTQPTSASVQTSLPSQPTVTTSPQVNVNITFNIGNGSAGTPPVIAAGASPVIPTDLIKADCNLPFGEEEESLSIAQQEAGKTALVSEQESESYNL